MYPRIQSRTDSIDSLPFIKELLKSKCDKSFSNVDDLSDDIQISYPAVLVYSLLAREFNYCVSYIVDIEYNYNKEDSTCELDEKDIKKFRIQAKSVGCDLKGSKQLDDCKGSDNELVILYTKIDLPKEKDNHISILLVDKKNQIIEYYEPQGYSEISVTCQNCIKGWSMSIYKDYKFKEINEKTGPGLQCMTSQGSCFLINLFYFYLKTSSDYPIEEVLKLLRDTHKKFQNFLNRVFSSKRNKRGPIGSDRKNISSLRRSDKSGSL